MPRALLLLLLWVLPAPGQADNRQLIEGVLQGVIGELARQEQEANRQQADAHALYNACLAGSSRACDLAVNNRWLGAKARRAVRTKMQALEAQRLEALRAHEAFVADWRACSGGEDAACLRAIAYPNLMPDDRRQLQSWRYALAQRARAEERRRHLDAAAEAAAIARAAPQQQQAPSPVITGSIDPPVIATVSSPPVPAQRPMPWHLAIVAVMALATWLVMQFGKPAMLIPEAERVAPDFAADPDLPQMTGDFPTDVRRVLSG